MRSRRHAASATLALSILLHLALFWYADSRVHLFPEPPQQPSATGVEILLTAPLPAPAAIVAAPAPPDPVEPERSSPKKPAPEEQTTHAPRDDGEQTAQASAAPALTEAEPELLPGPEPAMPSASTAAATPSPPGPSPIEPVPPEPSPPEPSSLQPSTTEPALEQLATLDASQAPALQAEGLPEVLAESSGRLQDPGEKVDEAAAIEQMSAAFNGRLVPLDDQTLADASLVTNAEGNSRNARIADEGFMVNLYLRRMTEQVYASWNDWNQWQQKHSQRRTITGTISFQVSLNGRLESARVSRSSGNADFDQSALRALKRVARFAVPEDPAVTARYYRRLRFHFSTESREIGAILKAGASAG